MKQVFLSAVVICLIALNVKAQDDKSKRPSPFAEVSTTTNKGVEIQITYSRPSVKGRQLGADIAPMGKVWRTGANEATTFQVNKDVKVNGQALKKGKYSIHSIPGETKTTVIFNSVWDKWGLTYDENDDVLRVEVPTEEKSEFNEQFSIVPDKTGKVDFLWGNYGFSIMIE